MAAYFAAVVKDQELTNILHQVEGVNHTWCRDIGDELYLIGCTAPWRHQLEFAEECTEVLIDAERVRDLLRDVEIEL